jgi:hypothetical protein
MIASSPSKFRGSRVVATESTVTKSGKVTEEDIGGRRRGDVADVGQGAIDL